MSHWRDKHDTLLCDESQRRGLSCSCVCDYCYRTPLKHGVRDIYTHTPPPSEETPTTMNADIREAEQKVRNAEQALVEAREALARAANPYPEEPEPNGSVITFTLKYVTGPRLYRYAAIKTLRGWSVTGERTDHLTWRQLIDWLRSGDIRTVSDIAVMSGEYTLEVGR